MQLNTHPTSVATKPAPIDTGIAGYFSSASPGSGGAPTIASSSFLNSISDELANIVLAGGLTLSNTVDNQVLTAIKFLIQTQGGVRNFQVFTSTAAFTVPVGITLVHVRCWGGGGGGNGSNGTLAGGGGGGGGYVESIFTVTPGATVTVTVGGAGAGAAYSVAGGNGGTSSFGAFCSATGGFGSTATSGGFGSGGSPTGGGLNLSGLTGSAPLSVPSGQAGGIGGGSFGGVGGTPSNSNGTNATLPGCGGSGGGSTAGGTIGGAGAHGLVIVEW